MAGRRSGGSFAVIVTTGGGRLGQVLVKQGDVVPVGTPLFTITEPNIAVTLNASQSRRETREEEVMGGRRLRRWKRSGASRPY